MSAWWDVLGALALSVPLYWASSRAGHRWARWRDLIRQERAIDRAEAEGPPVHGMSTDEFIAKRREIVARQRERQNEAAIRAGRGVVSLDVPPPPVFPPPAPAAAGGVGVPDLPAASMVPLIIHPDYQGDLEDLIWTQGFRRIEDLGEDETVRG
ncbi:hypothetical protein KNU62_gp05 [Gordonia phage Bakery]|uniref:Uncharacterized protein n=1 Tax=Gordonia phage Bakery TaxID=2591205 RepID=A0A514DGQ1_9CAUD|nr:hypothetical protein KNU62_gp05 [Gordonia phage Bakery]QDH92790.1 hypothetical protein SEA_BAKERY_5 [Gordonia phage Bakery]